MSTPIPVNVHYHKHDRDLELSYDVAGERLHFRLSAELLRVFSPSAEVRGHSPEQAVLQTGKKDVGLMNIEPVGNYALKLYFDDGHNSGLYSWAYLWEMCQHREQWWQDYLRRLEEAGASRESLGIAVRQLH
ncbi:gamma-butyrobetaine hydroxylase-like domain-containing protein [Kushneria phosphatilytica]|uniref:DUF971 domain-containing protein n=1 Tax=Kushneria phosphatilytica TaxID=657387 RepID=A0A1S1NQ45_9GAMM|nr:DUF971 domain-containing protein [Kushneria phosphatilytica]OHV10499.1 1-(5-phosphoribosyl)-5-((5-phosphoribosylamino)methylideneamino)imidazole-4-carboxamide isomerase [Kushneria phosphatilytica]QEL11946.1 DUF971 domain-containing protein [Kushneria phosphatilytica]